MKSTFCIFNVKSHSKSFVGLFLWQHTSNLITYYTIIFHSLSYFGGCFVGFCLISWVLVKTISMQAIKMYFYNMNLIKLNAHTNYFPYLLGRANI